jgi:hypothetical protein
MARSPDPTKDPEFQAVVQHFLKTPHKPHEKAKLSKRALNTPLKPHKLAGKRKAKRANKSSAP